MPGSRTRLSKVIPPLFCGTATFTSQYNLDPFALPTTQIVHRALQSGIRGFDTSPYYGPAEELLGRALDTAEIREQYARTDYFLATKVGRIASQKFDYSPAWVRFSIEKSLERLKTEYIDLVYCHDVEFVTPQEVLAAVTELRKIRNQTGTVRYIGISGYPLHVLCELAEMIFRETGEPLDAVMSYANFTLQNTTLARGLGVFHDAQVDVVLNASPLGMGLLRQNGVPVGAQGDFHPAPNGLREACRQAADFCDEHETTLEAMAIRFALEIWLQIGRLCGSTAEMGRPAMKIKGSNRLGVSVIGVSTVDELEQTMKVWQEIVDEFNGARAWQNHTFFTPHSYMENGLSRFSTQGLYQSVRKIFGRWIDVGWPSPGPEFTTGYNKSAPAFQQTLSDDDVFVDQGSDDSSEGQDEAEEAQATNTPRWLLG
ncbi:MAG: hypothetical protein M1823_000223 [Watsoniomyces obsoletus]|nr:MAG: hypothetical protein M1823_000223 [Watsoniomyces obsoletus]